MLTMEEARRLREDAPGDLRRRALADRRDFVFAVRDLRSAYGSEWGGELRVLINGNIVLHLARGYNDHMRTDEELPQFCIMRAPDGSGTDRVHAYDGGEELGTFEGVLFLLEPADYDAVVDELCQVAREFDEHTWLPDTLFPEGRFVHLIRTRVLEHTLVRQEAPYDFSKLRF
jgi:hypothetical protein